MASSGSETGIGTGAPPAIFGLRYDDADLSQLFPIFSVQRNDPVVQVDVVLVKSVTWCFLKLRDPPILLG